MAHDRGNCNLTALTRRFLLGIYLFSRSWEEQPFLPQHVPVLVLCVSGCEVTPDTWMSSISKITKNAK